MARVSPLRDYAARLYVYLVCVVAIRVELCGTAIVFWNDMEDRGIEKMEDLDEVQGDCNKERYIQRVVLLEQGTSSLIQVIGKVILKLF